jgi:ParB-like chromosome segregation protein Spo0J
MAAIKWKEHDEALEAFLGRYGIPWRLEVLNVADIRLCQGRLSVRDVDDDTVIRYAMAMEEGQELPPICVVAAGKAYNIAQGAHRFAAAQTLGIKELPCIVAEPRADQELWAIVAFANQLNGLPLSKNEAVQIALETMRRFPELTQTSVAAQLGLKQKTLSSAMNAERARKCLMNSGVRMASALPQNTLVRLHALRKSEPVMIEAAKAVVAEKMTDAKAKEFLSAVNREKNDSDRMRAIEAYKQPARTSSPASPLKRKAALPRDELERILSRLQGLLTLHPDPASLCLHTPHLHKQMTQLWRQVKDIADRALGIT